MQENYSVRIEHYAEGHFLKTFEKKYKSHWDITLRAIIAELERIDMLLKTDKAETICDTANVKIVKTKFTVVGTNVSAKTSGNRCIVAWHTDRKLISILLVYAKTDLRGHDETKEWKNIIRENYPVYASLF